MSEMTAAEALMVLKPLTTQFRAAQRLEELLTYAHRVEGVLPGLEAEIEAAKAALAKAKEAAAKSMDRDRERVAEATRKADEAIAAQKDRVDAAERAAAERCGAVEAQTAAKLAQLAEQVNAAETRLTVLRQDAQEAEAKLEAAQKLRAEALKALGGGG